jgi:hypothetical protein
MRLDELKKFSLSRMQQGTRRGSIDDEREERMGVNEE